MIQQVEQNNRHLTLEFLMQLAEVEDAAAATLLGQTLWTVETARRLAEVALQHADDDPQVAARWTALAEEILDGVDGAASVKALVCYSRARILVRDGKLADAETTLRRAQEFWEEDRAFTWLARSNLGLTQVLTMQGRYDAAESAARSAVEWLAQADQSEPAILQVLVTAYRNLANVLMFQERHGAALGEYQQAENYLGIAAQMQESEEIGESIREEQAHIALNRANALTFLDRPGEAEAALRQAIQLFDAGFDILNRGRARTNLGRLLLRVGRYAEALEEFDRSSADLIGEMPTDAHTEVERLRQADELLLEHATAYIALNLFPEADRALRRCEVLFRSAEQPFSLGQTLYAQGLLRLYGGDYVNSHAALDEAKVRFSDLGNQFWVNRTDVALAALDFRQGFPDQAESRMVEVLIAAQTGDRQQSAINWDMNSLAEARLLHARILMDIGKVDAARSVVNQLIAGMGWTSAYLEDSPPSPHIVLRLEHLRGLIEQADGNQEYARQHLERALRVLEQQRATLPLEEVRTAFLDDKASIYGDLVLAHLNRAPVTSEDTVHAFSVAERARSRSLLERLVVSVPDESAAKSSSELIKRRDAVRQEVHWLYNQMLDDPGRQQDSGFLQRLQSMEAVLDQLEWRSSSLRAQAESVSLAKFQESLPRDKQAIVYFVARDEVLAFLVDGVRVGVYRRLCSLAELRQAQSELRFQLGRIELGTEYVRRHGERLRSRLNQALGRLHDLLIEPLRTALTASKILVIPYGSMHLLPFHALWDGAEYLIQRYEFSYAPSASLAARNSGASEVGSGEHSFAGFAISDPLIPEAPEEVIRAASHFSHASVYLDQEATRHSLREAAARADVLHLATHGLFRPDNSFFSALKLADGWIDVREIYRLPLTARLVVLSACESGAGEIRGADEVIGLARGFIGAGARSLIVSLWNVHDASAADFMDSFYSRLNSAPQLMQPTQALRATQISAITEGQHPYYWAPFSAIE